MHTFFVYCQVTNVIDGYAHISFTSIGKVLARDASSALSLARVTYPRVLRGLLAVKPQVH